MIGDSRRYRVLFLGTGNAARSIIAEALLRQYGNARFVSFSAGTAPIGSVDEHTEALLRRTQVVTDGLHSKSLEAVGADLKAPFDFVFTVSDAARDLPLPERFETAVRAHWGVPDPGVASGDELSRINATRSAFKMLERRIQLFVALPIDGIDHLLLSRSLAEIGRS